MDQTINEMEKYVDKLNEVYSSLNKEVKPVSTPVVPESMKLAGSGNLYVDENGILKFQTTKYAKAIEKYLRTNGLVKTQENASENVISNLINNSFVQEA